MKDDELLTTTVTPECAHFLESWCLLSRLTLLDRHCPHSLTFYPAAAVCSQFVLLPLTASEGIIRWAPSRGGKTMCFDGFWSIRASQRRHLRVGGFSGSIAATSSSTFVRRCFRFAVSIARSCKFMRAAKPAAILGCNLPTYMSEINRAAVCLVPPEGIIVDVSPVTSQQCLMGEESVFPLVHRNTEPVAGADRRLDLQQ